MKKSLKSNKIYKKVLILLIVVLIAYVFIDQQKVLSSYQSTESYYTEQIAKQNTYNETLRSIKENISSAEYIEKFAREELDMYYPNERVYLYKN